MGVDIITNGFTLSTANQSLISVTDGGHVVIGTWDSSNYITTSSFNQAVMGFYIKPTTGIPAGDLAESYYLASNPKGYTSNIGTITGIRVNGAIISGTGIVNLGELVSLETTVAADAEIADENGNVALRLANGHIITKEFNSQDM
mgnify:CR=1 FL=1